jgi:hypothetical protein
MLRIQFLAALMLSAGLVMASAPGAQCDPIALQVLWPDTPIMAPVWIKPDLLRVNNGTVSGVVRWHSDLGYPRLSNYCSAFQLSAVEFVNNRPVRAGVLVPSNATPTRRGAYFECPYSIANLPTGVPIRIDAGYNGAAWRMTNGGIASSVELRALETSVLTLNPDAPAATVNFAPRISVRID